MKIVFVEPYLGGSHKTFCEGLAAHSRHDIEIIGLPARNWKWRMHAADLSLVSSVEKHDPDLIMASSMLDVSSFLGLSRRQLSQVPIITYFHENQVAYPKSINDKDKEKHRDFHYPFIQYKSALASDAVWFNSNYNLTSFYDGIEVILKKMPDSTNLDELNLVRENSEVVHLGMEFPDKISRIKHNHTSPLILWNHRWEYDKCPKEFFDLLYELDSDGFDFSLAVLGDSKSIIPPVFQEACERLDHKIVCWGRAESREEYIEWLSKADLLPVTSKQDFFGMSIVEAGMAGVKLLLPKRLAYPELIPSGIEGQCFYDGNKNLNELKKMILNWKDLNQSGLDSHLRQFTWKNRIKDYDDRFDALLSSFTNSKDISL